MDDKFPSTMGVGDINSGLTIRDTEAITRSGLSHETFHLFQKSLGLYDRGNRKPFECEQSVFQDIMFYARNTVDTVYDASKEVEEGYGFISAGTGLDNDKRYRNWLEGITKYGVPAPESVSADSLKCVFEIFEKRSSYMNETHDTTKVYDYKALYEGLRLAREQCQENEKNRCIDR